MKNRDRVEKVLFEADCNPRTLGRAELSSAHADWRRVYSAGVYASTRKWVVGHYDWHTFSRGFFSSVSGGAARVAVAELSSCEFVVLSSWDFDWFGFECFGVIPTAGLEALRVDVLVFERSLDWTIAFAHEEYFFFARAERTYELSS